MFSTTHLHHAHLSQKLVMGLLNRMINDIRYILLFNNRLIGLDSQPVRMFHRRCAIIFRVFRIPAYGPITRSIYRSMYLHVKHC